MVCILLFLWWWSACRTDKAVSFCTSFLFLCLFEIVAIEHVECDTLITHKCECAQTVVWHFMLSYCVIVFLIFNYLTSNMKQWCNMLTFNNNFVSLEILIIHGSTNHLYNILLLFHKNQKFTATQPSYSFQYLYIISTHHY